MRKPRRAATALSSGSAMARSRGRERLCAAASSPERARRTCARARSGIAPTSAMSLPPSFTASASGRRRLPLQASQVRVTRKRPSSSSRDAALVGVGVLVVRRPRRARRPARRGAARAAARCPRSASSSRARPSPSPRATAVAEEDRLAAAPRAACSTATSGLTPSASTARDSSVASATLPRRPHASTTPSRSVRRGSPMHALGIDDVARAETVARGAGAVRAVEREHARLDGRQRDAAVDAGEALAHPEGLVALRPATRRRPSPSLSASSTLSVRRPLRPSLSDEAIDDHVEVVQLACGRARSRRRGRRPSRRCARARSPRAAAARARA